MVRKTFAVLVISVVWALLGGCTLAEQHESEDANLALMKKFYEEVVNKGNMDFIDESFAEDFVEHEEFPGLEPGRQGVKQFFQMFRAAFPDLNFNVEFAFAKDDKVVAYITITGTQNGEFMGMPASGKTINLKAIDIVRFAAGKGAEHWGVTDSGAMMEQLGMIPAGGTTKK
ncbi:MAG: ester cyclase [bacterium]